MAITDNLYDPEQAKALGFQSASPTLNPDEMRIAQSLGSLQSTPTSSPEARQAAVASALGSVQPTTSPAPIGRSFGGSRRTQSVF